MKLNPKYLCTFLFISLLCGCVSQKADRFYRHSWEYQHSPMSEDVLTEVFDSVNNWEENIPSNKLEEVESHIKELESGFPLKSQIILTGGGGCLEYLPYNLYVVQIDDLVLGKLENELKEDTYFKVPMESYESFWNTYFEYRESLKKDSYGKSFSTGDYGFKLTLEFSKYTNSESASYKLIVGGFENEQVNELFQLLMEMVDEKFRIKPTDHEAFEKSLNETIKLHNQNIEPTWTTPVNSGRV